MFYVFLSYNLKAESAIYNTYIKIYDTLSSVKNLEPRKLIHKILRMGVPLFLLAVLMIFVGIVTAGALTTNNNQNSASQVPDVRLAAGPDSTSSTNTYPSANVNVAPPYNTAKISLSLFPSDQNTPQPATYYTNLLQIQNQGTANYTIDGITISDISGASNLGGLTIYLFANQTDNPAASNAIGSASLNASSTGTISLLNRTYLLPPSGTSYIEISGYAAANAEAGSTCFTINIETE